MLMLLLVSAPFVAEALVTLSGNQTGMLPHEKSMEKEYARHEL